MVDTAVPLPSATAQQAVETPPEATSTTPTPPPSGQSSAYGIAEEQAIVAGEGFQPSAGYVVPISQLGGTAVAQANPEETENPEPEAEAEKGFWGSIGDAVSETARQFRKIPEEVGEVLEPHVEGFVEGVEDVIDGVVDSVTDLGRRFEGVPKDAARGGRAGIQETTGDDKPIHYDPEVKQEGSIAGLEEVQPGLLYDEDYKEPSAQDLDGGFYGFAGVADNGGTIRSIFGLPTRQDYDRIEPIAAKNSIVGVGDAVYRLVNHDLDTEISTLEKQIEVLSKKLPAAIAGAGTGSSATLADVAEQQATVAGLERQVVEQEKQIALAVSDVNRIRPLVREGALAAIDLDTANDVLSKERQELVEITTELAAARESLIRAQASRTPFEGLEGLTPETLYQKVEDGNTADLPEPLVDTVGEILVAEATLEGRKKKRDSLIYRSPVIGKVTNQVPQGGQFNSLDGSLRLNDNTRSGLGDVPDDPERISSPNAVDGGTPTVVPEDETEAKIVFAGVSPTQAKRFGDGEKKVSFITADGRQGTGIVESNGWYTPEAGYRIVLKDAKFLNGDPLTVVERDAIRIFDELKPVIKPEWVTEGSAPAKDMTSPDEPAIEPEAPIEREGVSTDTVDLLDVTAPTRNPNELWTAEQKFSVRVPVWGRSEENPGLEPRIIAYVDVSGVVKSNRRAVEVKNLVATMKTLDGTTIPAEVKIAADLRSTGSSSGTDPTFDGSPREDSGVALKISLPIITDNASLADSDAYTNNATPGGVGFTWTNTESITALPDIQQMQLPIDIVPTGRLTGKIAQITTPTAVAVNVDDQLQADPED